MEECLIPTRLPCIVLANQVLLPTAFAQIAFPARNSAVLERLNSGSKDVFLVIIPEAAASVGSGKMDQEQENMMRAVLQGKVGTVATAGRVLQLSRVVQTGDWMLLLEGVCRVSIDAVMPSTDIEEDLDHVRVTQLELRPPGAPAPPPSSLQHFTDHSSTHSSTSASDATLHDLGKQLRASTRVLLRQLARSTGGAAPTRRMVEVLASVPSWRAADVVAAALSSNFHERLAVLKAVDHKQRVRLALAIVQSALDLVRAGGSVVAGQGAGPGGWSGARQGGRLSRTTPQDLGEELAGEDEPDDLDTLMSRLTAARPPPEVMKAATKEFKRLRQTSEQQPGYGAARAYLETLADLPWSRTAAELAAEQRAQQGAAGAAGTNSSASSHKTAGSAATNTGSGGSGSKTAAGGVSGGGGIAAGGVGVSDDVVPLGTALSLKTARQVLDRQHYGLDKIKDRVIEHLAVLRLKGSTARAPILCFIGPPGVGKTSLARSVAAVLGRPFVRIALGGVRDEAEIRGHRRTYVGAMPGRILAGLRRARCCDPVMLLDELDKLGKDAMRGDPSAALLEVLDPEQNTHFTDAYLGLPCDLSRVMFVATANRAADIPGPLLDRLEVISLGGYTLEEKVHIACNHLLPKALADHGLEAGNVHLPDHVMELIVDRYTREAGVRALARNLEALCRHVAVSIVSDHEATQGGELGGSHVGMGGHGGHTYEAGSAAAGGGGDGGHVFVHSALPLHLPSSATSSSLSGTTAAGVQCHSEGQHLQQLHHSGDDSAASTHYRWLSQHNMVDTTTSLAAVSEAPLDRFWSSHNNNTSSAPTIPHQPCWDDHHFQHHQGLDTAAGSQHHTSADGVAHRPAAQSSGLPGLLSKVFSTGRHPAPALQHSRDVAAHRVYSQQQAVTGMLEATPGSSVGSAGGASGHRGHDGGAGHGSTHRSGWFSWRHSGGPAGPAPGSHPPTTSTQSPTSKQDGSRTPHGSASQGSWYSRGVVAVGSQPQVQYQGMPQALPYPPDLLQQHGVITVTEELVEQVLGPPRFGGAAEASEAVTLPGVAAGLVWTSVGGSVQYIECACINKGSSNRLGSLTLTGQVGEVLEESARIALSWIRAHAAELGLASNTATATQPPLHSITNADTVLHTGDDDDGVHAAQRRQRQRAHVEERSSRAARADGAADVAVGTAVVSQPPAVQSRVDAAVSVPLTSGGLSSVFAWDVHVHLPAGAIPKDGPSAGITLAVALLSLLSDRVVRGDTAMTGELTLRGLVLPVGGIKEKLLAARHAGMTRVIVPARNMRDVVAEVPAAVRQALTIIPVERLEQVLAAAFDPPYALLPAPSLISKL